MFTIQLKELLKYFVVTLMTMAFFSATIFCCCVTRLAFAANEVSSQVPPCHAKSSKHPTSSSSTNCTCPSKGEVVQKSWISNLGTPEVFKDMGLAVASIEQWTWVAFQNTQRLARASPLNHRLIADLYLRYSCLRL